MDRNSNKVSVALPNKCQATQEDCDVICNYCFRLYQKIIGRPTNYD